MDFAYRNKLVGLVQQGLNHILDCNLVVDSIIGNKTKSCILRLSVVPSYWDDDRLLVGAVQAICHELGINAGRIDGYIGPQTEYAIELLDNFINDKGEDIAWRDKETTILTQQQLFDQFGSVGTNQTSVPVPYKLKIAWKPSKIITRFTCHEKVAGSIVKVLTRVKNYYGQERIEQLGLDLWGGCLNVRKMRGGTNWSTHSWGIAIDWDPAHNKLRWGRDKARFAKFQYEPWWDFWEEEGWVSLGREKNYDWMHVQYGKIID